MCYTNIKLKSHIMLAPMQIATNSFDTGMSSVEKRLRSTDGMETTGVLTVRMPIFTHLVCIVILVVRQQIQHLNAAGVVLFIHSLHVHHRTSHVDRLPSGIRTVFA